MKEFLQKYWKYIVLAVICLLLGASGGFFGNPKEVKEVTKVEYKDKIVEKIVTKVEIQKVVDWDQIKNLKKVIETLQKPDGTVMTKTTIEKKEENTGKATENKTEAQEKIVFVDRVQTKIVEKTVKNQPNWIVHAGAGISVPKFLGKPEIGVPGLQGAVIEAGVARKVVGPFFLGLNANTQGYIGLSLTGAF